MQIIENIFLYFALRDFMEKCATPICTQVYSYKNRSPRKNKYDMPNV